MKMLSAVRVSQSVAAVLRFTEPEEPRSTTPGSPYRGTSV